MSRRKCATSTVTWQPTDSLRQFYLAVFKPAAQQRVKRKQINLYNSALQRFEKFVGGRPRLGDVTHELLVRFAAASSSRRTPTAYAKQLAGCIREIVKAWSGDALPRVLPLPPAPAGSLRAYFEGTYVVEAMIDATPHAIAKTRRAIRELRRYAGDVDLAIDAVTDSVLAGFYRSLLDLRMPATTVNSGYRATLHAVLNHAADRNVIARGPRVKKLKEIRHEPDAWSVAEVERIVDAASRFRPGECYGQVPCNLWWRAILLVCWWTACRRGSLLAIRHDDFDLDAGTLYVHGEHQKNRHSQTYALGPDALEAVGAIWLPGRELFFPHRSPHVISRHFKVILAAAGIRPSRRRGFNQFHALRRSTATAVTASAGIGAAATLLGHSDSYTTRRYCDPTKAGGHDIRAILPSFSTGARRAS